MSNIAQIWFVCFSADGSLLYHLGSSYIIAYLKEKGITVQQFVSEDNLTLQAMASLILQKNPRIVGFTVYDATYFLVKELSQLIKERNPEIIIIAGGPTATFSAKLIMQDSPQIDICVQGEGEITSYELIEELKKKKNLNKIRGITYRSGKNLIRTTPRPLIKGNSKGGQLDILPSPYLSGTVNIRDLIKINQSQVPLITTRGCFYKCSFCNFSAMSGHTIRFHSSQRLLAELKILDGLRKEGIDFEVVICDDAFSINRRRVKEICRAILQAKIQLRIAGVEARADNVDKELLKLLFAAGVREICFGLESSSPEVLYNVRKVRLKHDLVPNGFKPEKRFIQKVKENVKVAKEIGFKTAVNMILGLPGDTELTAQQTLDFIRDLEIDQYTHNILTIHAGTAISRNYKKYAISKMRKPGYLLPDPILSPLRFSYDVNKIAPLEGKSIVFFSERRYNLARLTNSICGTYKQQKNNLYPEVVFVCARRFPVEWLKTQSGTKTIFIYADNFEFKNRMLTLAVGLTSFLHPRYKLLTTPELLKAVSPELKFNFSIVDFRKIDEIPRKGGSIFLIRDNQDVSLLERLSKGSGKFDVGFLNRQRSDCLLLDGCRWSSFCPARSLYRLIVDGQDNIKVCFHSAIIGKVGDNLSDLKKRIDSISQEKIKERNCSGCPAQYSCSKCLFIEPALEEIFCQLKRNNFATNNFINSFEFSRKIDYLCLAEKPELASV